MGTEIRIWDSGIPYGPGEDWNFEYGAVGSQITAKVWRVGEPEPSTPQFSGIDTSVVAGQIYLTSDVITADTPSFADATFDNLVFVVPEPATSWLGVWLVAGLLTRRTRYRCHPLLSRPGRSVPLALRQDCSRQTFAEQVAWPRAPAMGEPLGASATLFHTCQAYFGSRVSGRDCPLDGNGRYCSAGIVSNALG